MKKREAIENLKKAYEKVWEEIMYIIEESKDDYDSLFEFRSEVREELCYIHGYIRDFFFRNYYIYADCVTKKLYFREFNPNVPLERVFSRVDYETTKTLLEDYEELRILMRKEETEQLKKLDDYFRNYKY